MDKRILIERAAGDGYFLSDFFLGERVEIVLGRRAKKVSLAGIVHSLDVPSKNGHSCLRITVERRDSKYQNIHRIVDYRNIEEAYQLM